MKIHTTRFGAIEIEPDDILFFRNGLLGFEDCRHWVLLADADNSSVAWLAKHAALRHRNAGRVATSIC